MAHTYELQATKRDRVGKGAARALRRENLIPAVIYGDNKPPLSIALPNKETTLELNTGNFMTHVANVIVDGEMHQVIARDYQLDPVRDFLVHVDFLRISAKSRITVEIPVHFENEEEAPGIKRGGVLNVVRYAIEVEAPATQIPDSINIDLTGLDIGDSVHISAVTLPKGVEPTITDRDFTIATIAAPAGLKEELKGEGDSEGEEGEAAAEGAED